MLRWSYASESHSVSHRVEVLISTSQSNNLTGNKSKPALDLNGKASKDHVMIFTAEALAQGGLDRPGLVLIAMLCGGDYVQEVCGPKRTAAIVLLTIF